MQTVQIARVEASSVTEGRLFICSTGSTSIVRAGPDFRPVWTSQATSVGTLACACSPSQLTTPPNLPFQTAVTSNKSSRRKRALSLAEQTVTGVGKKDREQNRGHRASTRVLPTGLSPAATLRCAGGFLLGRDGDLDRHTQRRGAQAAHMGTSVKAAAVLGDRAS